MDPEHKCVLCGHTARFFCECAESVTFLCPICVTAHLGQMQNLVHQVQNLPWIEKLTGRADCEPPDLMKILCERPPLRLVYAVNPSSDLQHRCDIDKVERKVIMMGRQNEPRGFVPSASEVELLTRELHMDDLFMLCHSHSSRSPSKLKKNLGLFTFQPDTRNICFFNPVQGGIVWNQAQKVIPSGAGLCVMNSNALLMCTGGYSEGTWLADTFSIETVGMKTASMPRLLVERECHGVLEHKEYVYVFGGVNSTGILNQCERYSLAAKAWQTLPSLEKRISKVTPVLINNRIYLAGFNSSAVLEFNPATQKSKALFVGMLSMSEAVCAFTCGEHLFLLQGAFLVCADVGTGSNSQPARRKADHRHWYCPTPLLLHNGSVFFCRWYEEIWEFGLEHCTMRHLLTLDFAQFA